MKTIKISTVLLLTFILEMTMGIARGQGITDDQSVGRDQIPGIYAGGGLGRIHLKLQSLDDVHVAAQSINHSDDLAWTVFAGYRFTSNVSLEAAYIDFGEPSSSFQSAAASASGNYRVKLSGVSPNIVGMLPLGRFELFAKLGYYFYQIQTSANLATGMIIESTKTRADLLYSAGVGMHVLRNLSGHMEYERLNIENAENSDALWLTALWRF